MPLKELVAPAQSLAKKGVKISKQQQYLIEILFGIVSITPESKKLFIKDGRRLEEGDLYFCPEIVGSLDEIAKTEGKSLYKGRLSDALVNTLQNGGGLITAEDLAAYRVIARKPAQQHLSHLLEVMLNTNEARKAIFDESLHDEDVLEKLLASETIGGSYKKISSRLGNTTHISIIDSKGSSVSMTSSNGSGSGVAVPGTGILLNNILGEEDLNPQGFHKHPIGTRMTSMMSPTIVTRGGQPILSVGSAGSNRIRSAVLQVISNSLDFNMDVQPAINAARIHTEGTGSPVEIEKGVPPIVIEKLAQAGHQISLWKEKNLFFGGVQAVQNKNGELTGAGDPRRGGVAVIAK
jgi:gamma-glutamyltranspeptidase/glutathione hydrolase